MNTLFKTKVLKVCSVSIFALFVLTSCTGYTHDPNGYNYYSASQNSNGSPTEEISTDLLPTVDGPNHLYDNGFRLVKKTVELRTEEDSYLRKYDYTYDFEENVINVAVVSYGSREHYDFGYDFDQFGRMIEVFYTNPSSQPRPIQYSTRYDSSGHIVQLFRSTDNNNSFVYENDQLIRIHDLKRGSELQFEVSYDAQGLRTSVYDSFNKVTIHYERNEKGEISNIQTQNEWGEVVVSHELNYDEYGNHVKTTSELNGRGTYVENYSYEVSPEPIFNIGLVLLDLEPFRLIKNYTIIR